MKITYEIEPVYLPGSTFKVKDGVVRPRTPRKEETSYTITGSDGFRDVARTYGEARAIVKRCQRIDKGELA